MEDHYKGDSPSKKWARYEYWMGVCDLMGNEKFRKALHLVLVSREAGDIPVLLLMGVPPQNIIAVDLNPRAASAAQRKWPSVKVVCGDIVNIAAEYKRTIGSAFLDFCNPISHEYVERVMKVARLGLRDSAVLGVAFLCGREQDQVLVQSIEQSKELLRKAGTADRELASLSRSGILVGRLLLDGAKSHFVVKPQKVFYYLSQTKTSNGVPMASALMKFERSSGASAKKMEKKVHQVVSWAREGSWWFQGCASLRLQHLRGKVSRQRASQDRRVRTKARSH